MSKRKTSGTPRVATLRKRTRLGKELNPNKQTGSLASSPVSEEKPVRGEPPAWANNRAYLCDTLSWFRSLQGGTYQSNKICYGVLLDRDGGGRSYIDDEIVITRAGGGFGADETGVFTQKKEQDESTRSVDAALASKRAGVAVGLIIGDRNTAIKGKLPHRYNVMTWFRVVDVWFEKINGKTGAKIRYQKLDLEEPSWWAVEGSSDPPPLSERTFAPPRSAVCGECNTASNQIYEEGWMCLQRNCSAFWRLETGEPPEELHYHADFLNSREQPDDQIQPETSLVPGVLTSLYEHPEASTQRIAWRGVVCPECHKCVSRRYWNGWVCSDPTDTNYQDGNRCQWKYFLNMPLISLRSVVSDPELGVTKRAIRIDDDQTIQPQVQWTREYQKFTYVIDGVGSVIHYSANKPVLDQRNGPNELFERLQKIDLGLRRHPLKQSVVEGTLTAHFCVNFGMPYKFIVAVDSKSFSDAPPEIMHALSRLTWAIQQAVGPEALLPNEMLVVGYLEKMAMGYHDDGESSLGPTIATLSLGANATMKMRLKDEYFRGARPRSKTAVTDDAVLPGCSNFHERKALQQQFQRGEISQDKYNERRMDIAKTVSRRESENIISLDLHHGDLVVMNGTLLQKYYEHAVTSEDKLRFALTSRHIKADQVDETDHHKGEFKLEPDQIYDGH